MHVSGIATGTLLLLGAWSCFPFHQCKWSEILSAIYNRCELMQTAILEETLLPTAQTGIVKYFLLKCKIFAVWLIKSLPGKIIGGKKTQKPKAGFWSCLYTREHSFGRLLISPIKSDDAEVVRWHPPKGGVGCQNQAQWFQGGRP